MRHWLFGAAVSAALVHPACSDADRPGSAPGGGARSSGGKSSSSGGEGSTAQGGSDETDAGESSTGAGGADATAGKPSEGGTAGTGGSGVMPIGGDTGEIYPPMGDPPVCSHDSSYAEGVPLPLSGAGNDVMQAITPDELSIAWQNGTTFYVADRADVADPFGTPQAVADSAQYSGVALGPDGTLLVAVDKGELTVLELRRAARGQAFGAPSAGAFSELNATRSGIPAGSQVLSDPVVSPSGTAFFFSHYMSDQAGKRATIRESHSDVNGSFPFASPELGSTLYADGIARRVPTGVSTDLLTLFYEDQVEGEMRVAWRVNTQVQFDRTETLDLGAGTQAVVPNGPCSRLYYSAQGDSDLDLFTAELVTN